MNHRILTSDVQSFLKENASKSSSKIAFKKSPFEGVTSSELAEQIDSLQRLKNKLPHWLECENIYYPPRRNAEQCSSERTALYKAGLVKGDYVIDLTGGFGVDTWAFSQQFKQIKYCEINPNLFSIAEHNFKSLRCNNVQCHCDNGLEIISKQNTSYDLIYIDPARRDKHNRKMVGFADCIPDVIANKTLLLHHSSCIMLKASPMMDISLALEELQNVKEAHVVSVKNECKELLFLLEKDWEGEPIIKAVDLNENDCVFSFSRQEEQNNNPNYSEPLTYLYEPNSSILKAGAFNVLTELYYVKKLHPFTHLYTSEKLISNFPGKTYKVTAISDYNKKAIAKHLPNKKANIKTYNFPHSPEQVKKKLGLKDGSNKFLFGVKTAEEKYQIILAERVLSSVGS